MHDHNAEIVFDRAKWRAYARWEKTLQRFRWCPPLRSAIFWLIRIEADLQVARLR